MNLLVIYKTSRSAGGLLVNSYFTDKQFANYTEFWHFAPYVVDFDLCFSGSDTEALAVVSYPANSDGKYQGSNAFVWGTIGNGPRGRVIVNEVLPWRWCRNVAFYPRRGRAFHHSYHDSLSREMAAHNDEGQLVLKWGRFSYEDEMGRWGVLGQHWREWLRFGVGGLKPGDAVALRECHSCISCGILIKNGARRAQANILQQSVDLQAKVVGLLQLASGYIGELLLLHSEDTGHWIRARLRAVTSSLMGVVIALAQTYLDNEKGENDQTINNGDGWLVRYGATGATLSGEKDKLDQQLDQDLRFLQRYPSFTEPSGDEWFTNENAREWFKVADEWAARVGAFGWFDFLNPNQTGLKDMKRLDNYTPGYPDLPRRVDGLPQPQKNPEKIIEIPGPFGLSSL